MHKYPPTHTHTHTSTYTHSSACLYCSPEHNGPFEEEKCFDISWWESLIGKNHPEASLFCIIQAEEILGFFFLWKKKENAVDSLSCWWAVESRGGKRIFGITHLSHTHIHTCTYSSLTNLRSESAFRFLSLDKEAIVFCFVLFFSGCLNLEAG